MDTSAGVAELPDSTSCLPKYSDGLELPARYCELWGAAPGGTGAGREMIAQFLCHPSDVPKHWCITWMWEQHLGHLQPSKLASCGLAPARTVLRH